MKEVISDERLGEIRTMLEDRTPQGFRAVAKELHNACYRQRLTINELSRWPLVCAFTVTLAGHLAAVGSYSESSLHAAAALELARLVAENADLRERLADAVEMLASGSVVAKDSTTPVVPGG